ncbi:MAG: 2-dehydropantoate 2-reductase N-terminal domain-containing protein [Halieaceae bacterium]
MRILVYGAGNMGCLYAARLAQSGQDVAILARGDRLDALRDHGINLENGVSGERTVTTVPVVDRLAPEDAYDLVLVVLPKPALAEVLPILAMNEGTPSVMFFGNDAAGPAPMISALGSERVLLGFPGAAGIPHDGAIRYIITSRREQPTTIGELDGGRSERIAAIAELFEGAGFPAEICSNMDAWLKTHVAKILPTVGAFLYAGGKVEQLATHREALRLMVRAMREGFQVLRANGIPITPSNHRVLLWLPEWLLVFIMKRVFSGETVAIKVGHAEHEQREFALLAEEFRALNAVTQLPTPAMDRLVEQIEEVKTV